jgi:hypothetical protein
VSAQKLGQLQPFMAVFPAEYMGQLPSFWANLTPFSRKGHCCPGDSFTSVGGVNSPGR